MDKQIDKTADSVQDQAVSFKADAFANRCDKAMSQDITGKTCAKEAVIDAIVEALISAMRYGDTRTRYYALKALGNMGQKIATGSLVLYLKDHDPDIRCDAARSLGQIKDKSAVKPLIECLEDEDAQVRICAIQSLKAIGDADCVEPIIDALSSETDFHYEIDSILSGNYRWEIRELAVRTLGELGDRRAVKTLLDVLQDEDADLMLGIILKSLVSLGDPQGIEAVSIYLKDPDPLVRRMAAKAFCAANEPGLFKYLTEALVDDDSIVKINALEAVGNIGAESGIVLVILSLKDNDADVRCKAVEVIGRIGGKKAFKHILPLLDDPVTEVCVKAAETLGSIESGESVEQLIEVLEKRVEDESLTNAAILALIRIGDVKAVKSIKSVLLDKDRDVRLRSKAVIAMGRIKSDEGFKAVMNVLLDKSEANEIRQLTLHTLRLYDERLVLPGIKEALGCCDELLREKVAGLLREFSSPESEDMLIELLADESESVKSVAAVSLGFRENDAGFGILASMVRNDASADMYAVFDAIRNIANERSEALLVEGFNSREVSVRCGAIRAAGQGGKQDFSGPLTVLLEDSDVSVRREAVISLGNLADESALVPLVSSLYDFENFNTLHKEIAVSLKKIDAFGATELLLDKLTDKNKKDCHWVTIEALSVIHDCK